MIKSIVLRFRDTGTNDTIKEHCEIIKHSKYVWWGWWKKEKEPDRANELVEITRDLKNSTLKIGLFDRSTERFFIANLYHVHFDEKEVSINSPEPIKTPSYYKDKKVAAWFKLNKIKPVEKSRFIELFGEIPIENYTFFPVLPATGIVSTARVIDRIKLPSNIILHLSDLHLGSDFGFPETSIPNKRSLIDILKDDLMSGMNLKIGLLILSGDLTTRADMGNLINIGLPFLKKLTEILKIDRNQVIIIPGNHDIPLRDSNFHNYSHETAFKFFLEKFYDDDTKEITGIDKFILPGDKLIDILRINSARLRKKEEMNYGYVEWYYYKNLLNKLIDQDSKSLKIAAMHHHLVSVPYEENLDPDYPEGGISITLDSGRVIEGLQKFGFKCVLHGHQHLPGITKIARGRTPTDSPLQISGLEENLYLMASGSAGVSERRFSSQMKYNSYSILKILDDKIELHVRQYNPHIDPTTYYSTIINI